QILDDGRLTDSQGRTVNFKNTILIMTSNLGSQYIAELSGAPGAADAERFGRIKQMVLEELKHHFRPEFLNRVDETVVFHPLGQSELTQIVVFLLGRVRQRLAAQGLALEVSDSAKRLIGDEGFDPAYGARPLRRAIQRLVENPLAKHLLAGDFVDGDTIGVDVGAEGELVFTKAETREPVGV
ncbi:MAG: AAA family ATPase, partial [bacterium]